MRRSQVSLLTIGDEVTSGQISNRNAQWLAQNLSELGLKVQCQLSCNDVREEIVASLQYLSASSATICLTGGLGPTTDDLTRDAVAEFAKLPLVFHQDSWDRITQFFRSAGVEPKDTNRQQCFFPQSATIFPNAHGTADGFLLKLTSPEITIVVLPGPPHELQPMWRDSVENLLRPMTRHENLTCWRLIGIGESALQYEINKLSLPPAMRLGYRASMPIVEVKLWQPEGNEKTKTAQEFTDQLIKLIQPWLYENHQEDHLKEFFGKVIARNPRFHIYDNFTRGYVHHLLTQRLSDEEKYSFEVTSAFDQPLGNLSENSVHIYAHTDEKSVVVHGKIRGDERQETISLPFAASRRVFNQRAIAHLSLLKIMQWHTSL